MSRIERVNSLHKQLYYSLMNIDDKDIVLAYTNQGLSFIGSFDAGLQELQEFYPQVQLEEVLEVDNPYAQQVREYFEGSRQVFQVEKDVVGTDFQRQVWQVLETIPFGQTSTYGEIAQLIGRPKAVRAVGAAIGKNPISIIVPCHRVLGKNGALTGFRGGIPMKVWLLDHEAKYRKE